MKVIYIKQVGKIPQGRIAKVSKDKGAELIEKGEVKEYLGAGLPDKNETQILAYETDKGKELVNLPEDWKDVPIIKKGADVTKNKGGIEIVGEKGPETIILKKGKKKKSE